MLAQTHHLLTSKAEDDVLSTHPLLYAIPLYMDVIVLLFGTRGHLKT